ncbi:uncharacterized protein LOC103699566 isoform X2 [Phoenix dactylifera]|uniref:Uncharacterized protein LOC103699566 isoform X2 n=1 Tax=Phoenix dactylifera TaxID=42345 RepID=A0A8B8ZW66_PHODC|nr:uncharacterized protein LOC103699566 isoform X2 [Phoenix dactylifera]
MEGEGAVEAAEDVPAANGEEPTRPSAESVVQGNPLPGTPQNLGDPSDPKPPLDRNEIFRALEVVERDSTAIAESFASLFSSLRLALSEVTSTSAENMQCFSEVVGRLQESALDAASKGNRYINSCLRFMFVYDQLIFWIE